MERQDGVDDDGDRGMKSKRLVSLESNLLWFLLKELRNVYKIIEMVSGVKQNEKKSSNTRKTEGVVCIWCPSVLMYSVQVVL